MKRHALDFGTNFAAYDRMTSITNSMHVLVCHVPAYIAAGLKVDAFSQQGVEMAVGVRQRRVKSHISRNTSIPGQSYPGQLMALNDRDVGNLALRIARDENKICATCKRSGHASKGSKLCEHYTGRNKKQRVTDDMNNDADGVPDEAMNVDE